MLAKIATDGQTDLNFKHLGGAIAFKIKDIPENAVRLILSSKNQKISGEFTIDLTEETPTYNISESHKASEIEYEVTFPKSTTKTTQTFYIPLPCGELNGFLIEIKDENSKTLSDIEYNKTITIERAHIYYFADYTCIDIEPLEPLLAKEKAALIALYQSTNGDNWTNNTNWCTDRPVNEWNGVVTNKLGLVTDISLDNNNLVGSLPDNFGDLSCLERLYLSQNPSLTSLNSSMENLVNLEKIELYESGLKTIPSYLGSIKSLKYVRLTFSDLSGSTIPDEVYNLTNLVYLDLYETGIGGTISDKIGNLTKLEELNLANNNLTGTIPASIVNLKELRTLCLNGNCTEDVNGFVGSIPADLDKLTKLEYLDLSNNKLTGDIPIGIWKLPNLIELNLYGNQFNAMASQSTDYTHEGDVVTLQTADSKYNKGIDIVFLGSAFLDTDVNDGTYVEKMTWAMNSLFTYEPYKSMRDRFNVYTVKAISANNMFYEGASLAFNNSDNMSGRTILSYAQKAPNVTEDNVFVCLVVNSNYEVERSLTSMDYSNFTETSVAYLYKPDANVLVHELGGHAIGKLDDEYIEPGNEGISATDETKANYDAHHTHGWSMNVDYHSDASTVLWKDFIGRDGYSEVGIYEGAGTIGYGLYRPTDNSMMNANDCPFNAPSRYAIYKRIIKLTEDRDCMIDEFVSFDKAHPDVVTRTAAPLLPETERARLHQQHHARPVLTNPNWRER